MDEKTKIALDNLNEIVKYAEKCRDIQIQILDYCVELSKSNKSLNKKQLIEDLRAIVMWAE